jgi:hypothetical protein
MGIDLEDYTSNGWELPNLPADLNPSNRPVRTRMPGGVAGDVEPYPPRPYADPKPGFFELFGVNCSPSTLKPLLTIS